MVTARSRARSPQLDEPAPAGPIRTCVGCRARATARDVLRIVRVADVIVPDPARRLPGRGAHLHPNLKCYDTAVRRKALTRALRLPAALPSTAVLDYLTAKADPS